MFNVSGLDRKFAADKCNSSTKNIWIPRILAGECYESYWVQTFAEYRHTLLDSLLSHFRIKYGFPEKEYEHGFDVIEDLESFL